MLLVILDPQHPWTVEILAYEVGDSEDNWQRYYRGGADSISLSLVNLDIETMHEDPEYNK